MKLRNLGVCVFLALAALAPQMARAGAPIPPLPPTGFIGTALSTASIRWTWTDNAVNENGYRVFFGTMNLTGNLAVNTTVWLQTGLTPNRLVGPLFAQVFGPGGNADSNTDSAYTLAAAPAALTLGAVSSTTISLSWSANGNPSGTTYELERDSGGGFLPLAATTATFYSDVGLSPLGAYSYRVRAVNGDGIPTAYAGPVSTTTAAPNPPAPPSGFAGTAASSTQIQWTWSDQSVNEAGFRVMSGSANVSGDLPQGTTFWLQSGLSPNQTVGPLHAQAFNAGGTGDSNTDSATTLAATPEDLAITAVSSTTLALDWTDAGNTLGTVYEVERSLGVGFVFLASTTATDFTDSGLSPETFYSYRVRAVNADGVPTAYAGPVSSTTTAPDPPAAPSGFSGTTLSSTQISWTWTDASDNEAGFRVMSGSTNVSGDLPQGTTFWLQSGLSSNQTVGPLHAQAFNAGGTGDSNTDSATTLAATPEDLAITAVSSTTLALDWTDAGNTPGTTYEVERFVGAVFVFIASTTATDFTDSGLSPETLYSYRVRAVNADGIPTAYAGPVSTTTAVPGAPTAPAGFSGATLSSTQISWTWTDASDNEAGFRVMSGSANVSGDLPQGTTFWLQSGLSPNQTVGPLHAQAFNAGGAADSNTDSATTLAATPEDLAITAVSSTTIALDWTDAGNTPGTTYEVERFVGAVFVFIASTTATDFTDSGLSPETLYSYRVRAVNADGIPTAYAGPVSTTASSADALPPSAPPPPGAIAATATSSTSISAAWTPGANLPGAVYELERSTTGGSFALILTTTSLAYADSGLAPSTTYFYRVRAVGPGGPSAYAGPAAAATLAPDAAGGGGGGVGADPDHCVVRAELVSPTDGQRVKGDRLSLVARLCLGRANETSQVLFQYKLSGTTTWLDVPPAADKHPNPDASFPYFTRWDTGVLAPGGYDLRAVAFDLSGAPDAGAPAIRVTIVGAGVCDLAEYSEAGGVRVERLAPAGVPFTLYAGSPDGGQLASAAFPSGALAAAATVTARLRKPLLSNAFAPAGEVLELEASSGQLTVPAASPIAVTITYQDADRDGFIDGTRWRVGALTLLSMGASGAWEPASAVSIDERARAVSALSRDLRGYALFTPMQTALDLVRIFPMPFKPNAGGGAFGVPYTPGNADSGIIFDNLPPAASIKIYTVTGRLVRALAANGLGRVQWDVKNDGGTQVASGGYLAVIAAEGHPDVTRKLLILK